MANHRGRLVLGIAIVSAALATLGCASAPREVELPPQTLTGAPTSTVEQEAALVSPPRAEPKAAVEANPDAAAHQDPASPAVLAAGGRRHTIVIDSVTASEVTPQTLREASDSERERRAATNAPVAVITNSNLAELADGGQLTIIGSPVDEAPAASTAAQPGGVAAAGQSAGASGAATTSDAATLSQPPNEEYWRGQALKLRLDWKAAVERVGELESEAQELRRRFYEEDDPFYRDNQIKPTWDRTLDLLDAAKTAAEDYERKLSRFLDEGRQAGALPGWLREGVEFEPPPTADRTPAERRRSDDPWEPKILHEDTKDP